MEKLKRLFSIVLLEKIILFYMLVQPAVDIVTSFLVRGGINFTLGVALRALFLGLMGLYLLFFYRGPKRKLILGYLLAVIAFVALHLGLLFAQGGLIGLFTNIKEAIKVFYFPCVLVAFWALYKEHGYQVRERSLVTIGVFYALTIFVSFVTDTSFQSYNGNGYCGWFYAANEISAITIILAPMVFWYFTNRSAYTQLQRATAKARAGFLAIAFVSVLLMLFAASYLATKAAFFGVVAYLLCFLIWSVFRLEITKDKLYLFRTVAGLVMILCMTVLFFAASPVKEHLLERLPWFHYVQVQTGQTAPVVTTTEEPPAHTWQTTIAAEPSSNTKSYRVLNWLLSSRLNNNRSVLAQYREVGLSGKLFGLGYTMQPSYRYDVIIAVEMDFVCVLLRHGIVGVLLFSAPFIGILCAALWRSIRMLKHCMASLLWCTSLYQTMIAFAVGFLTGHTFVAPAVSIYVICSLIRLLAEADRIQAKCAAALPENATEDHAN